MSEVNNDIKVEGLSEKEAKQFKEILTRFIKSYSAKDENVSDAEWFAKEMKAELPELSDDEAKKMADEALASIKEYNENLKSINDTSKSGKSSEKWFAEKVSKAATGVSIIQHGQYLDEVSRSLDEAISTANQAMEDTVLRLDKQISMNPNLDGFIAEQYHVNTFNANAVASGSPYRAKVLTPDGKTFAKNSVDIEIIDEAGKVVKRYQAKYCSTPKGTERAFTSGDYRGQQKLVPSGQGDDISAITTECIEAPDGTKSNPLTKEEAKALQQKAQKDGIIPKTDWNSFNTKELALQIGKSAGLAGLQAAAITTGFSLAEQVIKGEGIDTEKTVESALKSGADTSVKLASAGALKVATEKGIIKLIPKGMPIGTIANVICVAVENIKILGKVATGEITISQAMDQMGRTTTSMVYGIGWGTAGATTGAVALCWIPVVGPFVGGLAGGMVGYMAGSKFGSAVYSGIKIVKNGIVNACKSGLNKIKSFGSKIGRAIFG